MSDLDLQQALRALGARLEAEAEIDFASAVLARIASSAPQTARPRRKLRIAFVGVAIGLLAAAVAVAALQTVRGWLRQHGVDVSRSERLASSGTATDLPGLGFGTPVTAAEAERALVSERSRFLV